MAPRKGVNTHPGYRPSPSKARPIRGFTLEDKLRAYPVFRVRRTGTVHAYRLADQQSGKPAVIIAICGQSIYSPEYPSGSMQDYPSTRCQKCVKEIQQRNMDGNKQ